MKSRTSGRRAGAIVFSLAAVGIVLVAISCEPVDTSGGTQSTDVASIETFDVAMDLKTDGTLTASEEIAVSFPIQKHGIFRIFDTKDPRRDAIEHPVNDLEVTRDGAPEPWTWVDSASGTESARIGNADVFLPPGTYDYGLSYSTSDVLEPGTVDDTLDPDATYWWWDVVGSGWQMPIGQAKVVAELPAEPISVECVRGNSTPCTADVVGTTVSVTESNLAPHEPVTLRIGFDSTVVPANSVPPASRTLLWSLIAGAIGAALAFVGVRSTKEVEPGFPVLFEPPTVPPAVAAYVLDETHAADEFQATILHLAERGVLQIDQTSGDWTISMLKTPGAIDPWELGMLSSLGLNEPLQQFTVSKSIAAGKRIETAKKTVTTGVEVAASPYLRRSGGGSVTAVIAWLCLLGLAVMTGLYLFAGFSAPIPLMVGMAAFAVVGSLAATDVGRTTKRTAAGRDVWSRTGGFARFLTTDSSESRFDAAERMDLFPKFLPWAVAFGVSEEWSQRYEAQGVATPAVPYVLGWGYAASGRPLRSFNDSFNSAISSASAAYSASQSSSGGGGGFSGGSGGGGGGGGSW